MFGQSVLRSHPARPQIHVCPLSFPSRSERCVLRVVWLLSPSSQGMCACCCDLDLVLLRRTFHPADTHSVPSIRLVGAAWRLVMGTADKLAVTMTTCILVPLSTCPLLPYAPVVSFLCRLVPTSALAHGPGHMSASKEAAWGNRWFWAGQRGKGILHIGGKPKDSVGHGLPSISRNRPGPTVALSLEFS